MYYYVPSVLHLRLLLQVRSLSNMSVKILTSPLRIAQENAASAPLPCLSSTMRSLNTTLNKFSGETKYVEHKDQISTTDSSSSATEEDSTIASVKNDSAADLYNYGHSSSDCMNPIKDEIKLKPLTIAKNIKINDIANFQASSYIENKENCNPDDKSFMLAMLADTLCSNMTNAVMKRQPISLPENSGPSRKFSSMAKADNTSDDSKNSLSESNTQKVEYSDTTTKSAYISQEVGKSNAPRPFTVSIEGNISSGKSTFLKHFSTMPEVATYQEPLWKWTDVGGHNLLGKLYEDPQRWSFLFQSYVQLTRLSIHLNNEPNKNIKLIERSLHNNRYCFVENGHDSGHLQDSEYDVLCEYFDFLEENLNIAVDLIVYLRTSPEVVHDRMKRRGRTEEAGVPITYLQRVHDYYEQWLMKGIPRSPPAPVLVIDANSDLETVTRHFNSHKAVILGKTPYEMQRARTLQRDTELDTHSTDKKSEETDDK
uniref:Deoxynucleoside kinase-like isoform X1 n=1 Tax=Hirondellea gigas TaxID=1518452 RepID=A0A6A7G0G5_9CRUS